jgi:hypothetical protein
MCTYQHEIFLSGTIAVILLNILFVLPANAQSYGLGFNSHEVVQDKRTTLSLQLDNVSQKDNLEVRSTFLLSPTAKYILATY